MTTYTIAYDEVLFAIVPDGQDIDQAVARELEHSGFTRDEIDLKLENGLTLTDDVDDGDEIVWRGSEMGFIRDENDHVFRYIVRR